MRAVTKYIVPRPLIAAVVVTFSPDGALPARLEAIARECDAVIVVDNASDEQSRSKICSERFELIALPENRGLAEALNIGLRRAMEAGFEWAVTFDQDSTPLAGMVEALWHTGQAWAGRVAVVGPNLTEERTKYIPQKWVVPHPYCSWLFRRVECRANQNLEGVAFVITSGSLMSMRVFREIGEMESSLYIDYIDHDYCLRAHSAGYKILVSGAASLIHNLGARRDRGRGLFLARPNFHSALRLRYMARNRWVLWRRYAWAFPHWAAFDAVYSHYNLLRVLVFEDERLAKLVAVVRGTWDGLRGRRGRIS